MSTQTYFLEPADAWFFGDGRPYDKGEASQTAVKSLFPPHPPTVMGALRAALARSQGWRDGTRWGAELGPALGTGPDMGPLRMRGPYPAMRRADARIETLWPLPAHVVGTEAAGCWSPRALMAPGPEPVPCDLGDVRLPVIQSASDGITWKGKPGRWVDTAGLDEILAGKVPAAAHVHAAPWCHEMRVGIMRDEETRSTGETEHALYSPLMVRMQRGAGLVAELSGVADGFAPGGIVPLGGESRLAVCEPGQALGRPACPAAQIRAQRRCVVVHLGPAWLDPLPGPGSDLPGLPGPRVVSACLLPAVHIGGWDGRTRVPLGLVPHVAPGSVWFCELPDAGAVDAVLAAHDTQIGKRPEQGFGHIVLGLWPEAPRSDR